MKTSSIRTLARKGVLAGLLVGACCSWMPCAAGSLTEEDRSFAAFLIKDLRYLDTADRWLTALEKSGRLQEGEMADVASWRIDILQAQGKSQEVDKALAEFKKKFKTHARASLGDLERVAYDMGKVVAMMEQSQVQSDKKKAADLAAKADKLFQESVSARLDAMAAELGRQVDEARKAAAGKEKGGKEKGGKAEAKGAPDGLDNLIRARDQAELSRLKSYLVYARKLPSDSPQRKKLLEKGYQLAEQFVESRYEFYVMQYDGQLQKGLLAFELGRYDLAEENLALLYDIVPPGEPPFPKPLIDAFRTLRLQAILFGARALIAEGAENAKKARDVIETNFLKGKGGSFDLSHAEDEADLRQYAVLVRLEYGVALAAVGKTEEGLDQIQQIIRKYSGSGAVGQSANFVNDARKALGRIAVLPGVRLRGQDYYQAGLGLKSELRWGDALRSFQKALSLLRPAVPAERTLMASCLNEIGEANFVLGRILEAAVAYDEVRKYFQDADDEVTAKVATNFLASVDRADKDRGGEPSAALAALKGAATQLSDEKGKGLGIQEFILSEARKLEGEGRFDAAREKYMEVQTEVKSQKVPFYYYAQICARICVYRAWDAADENGKKALDGELEKMIGEIEELIPKALEDDDKRGAGAGALALGTIHYQRSEWKEAVEHLKMFASELADEPVYHCAGLGYLVLAEVRAGDTVEAAKHFDLLQKKAECTEEPVVAYGAWSLAEGFELLGEGKKAAEYALAYAAHPAAKGDLQRPEVLLKIAQYLIDGGRSKDADSYIADARKLGGKDIDRQLLILESRKYTFDKDWNKVIEVLEDYVAKFEARGNYYEDPDVRKDLAEAYITRGQPKPPFKDIQSANQYYGTALAIILQRLQQVSTFDAKLDRIFWTWGKRYMQVKMFLGDSGETSAYGDIRLFYDNYKHTEMGGLKADFQKLSEEAAKKQGRSGVKTK